MSDRLRRYCFASFVALIATAPVAVADAPEVNGTWERIGPYPVLKVWGTPEEMGFAHGYLLAKEILQVVSPDLRTDDPRAIAKFDGMMRQLLKYIKIDPRTQSELESMHQGITAKLGDRAILEPFNRQITIDDLILHNAGDLLRAFGCSGFTVWGENAGPWGVITTRNFDYPIGNEMQVDTQMILVRSPDGDRSAVATITWPGYIGAFTGVNEHGVCTFMHDGTGGRTNEVGAPVTPVALTLSTLLESTNAKSAHDKALTLLRSGGTYPFSYMIRVVSPVADGEPASPEWVIRVDPSGVSQNPVGTHSCITTNHYLDANLQPVDGANEWSLTRYKRLEDRLATKIDPGSAWDAQGSVATQDQSFPTVHTLVVYPAKRKLDLGFATWNGKVIAATKSKPTTIAFDQLFR